MSSSIFPIASLIAFSMLFVVIQLYMTYCASPRNHNAEREAASELAARQHLETRRGLSLREVSKLPCYEFAENGATPPCPICLEMFRCGEKYRVLPQCGHAFHVNCVDLWLVRNATCPLCRKDVTRNVVQEEQHVVVVISPTQYSLSP